MAVLNAKRRNALAKSQFADPENRGFPIHDAAHVRNAAARLEQQKGSMSDAKYKQIRARIAAAAKRFGVDSKFNEKKGGST